MLKLRPLKTAKEMRTKNNGGAEWSKKNPQNAGRKISVFSKKKKI